MKSHTSKNILATQIDHNEEKKDTKLGGKVSSLM